MSLQCIIPCIAQVTSMALTPLERLRQIQRSGNLRRVRTESLKKTSLLGSLVSVCANADMYLVVFMVYMQSHEFHTYMPVILLSSGLGDQMDATQGDACDTWHFEESVLSRWQRVGRESKLCLKSSQPFSPNRLQVSKRDTRKGLFERYPTGGQLLFKNNEQMQKYQRFACGNFQCLDFPGSYSLLQWCGLMSWCFDFASWDAPRKVIDTAFLDCRWMEFKLFPPHQETPDRHPCRHSTTRLASGVCVVHSAPSLERLWPDAGR